MDPLSPSYSVFNPSKVPIVFVGQAITNCHPVGPAEVSRWDDRPVQLWTVKVKVEHVLQGDVQLKEADIFYYLDHGASTGGVSHLADIYAGHSEIFFLQKDGSRYRTICDGWRSCVFWVRTGTHSGFKVDPTMPIEDVMTNLFLSRGDDTSDQQMIDAIYHPEARWGWVPVLNNFKRLELEERSPTVRAVLQERLHNSEIHYGIPSTWTCK